MYQTAAFFLGSGISYSSKGPKTGQITDGILNECWSYRHHDFRRAKERSDGKVQQTQHLLRAVSALVETSVVNTQGRPPNYEDLYAACSIIAQSETTQCQDPFVQPAITALRDLTGFNEKQIRAIAQRATDLIEFVAYDKLRHATAPKAQELELLSRVANEVCELDIFTLNHDILIEEQLHRSKIDFTDGFTKTRKLGRRAIFEWDPKWTSSSVRLLKLHGSIDWQQHRFRNKKGEAYTQFAAHRRAETKLPKGSLFLSGTGVKEQSYGVFLIGDLFVRFRDLISNHRSLFCCGYGWGDYGINIRLLQWLGDQPENRLVVLHGQKSEKAINGTPMQKLLEQKEYKRLRSRIEGLPLFMPDFRKVWMLRKFYTKKTP